MKAIRERLNAIDLRAFTTSMGPFATYTDTFVELKIHLASEQQNKDFTLQNPWPCDLPSCSDLPKKNVPADVKAILCEISSLRSSLSGEPPLAPCDSGATANRFPQLPHAVSLWFDGCGLRVSHELASSITGDSSSTYKFFRPARVSLELQTLPESCRPASPASRHEHARVAQDVHPSPVSAS